MHQQIVSRRNVVKSKKSYVKQSSLCDMGIAIVRKMFSGLIDLTSRNESSHIPCSGQEGLLGNKEHSDTKQRLFTDSSFKFSQ